MSELHSARWARTRAAVLRRDNFVCYWCGAEATQADHLVSRAEGGSFYAPNNLVASCQSCNASRGAHVTNAKRGGRYLGSRRSTTKEIETRSAKTIGAIRV